MPAPQDAFSQGSVIPQEELDKTVASIGRNIVGVQGDVREVLPTIGIPLRDRVWLDIQLGPA